MAVRVKRASFQTIARSKLAVKDAKRAKVMGEIRGLFTKLKKEKSLTEPARRSLLEVRERKKQAKIDRNVQLIDARRSKRKKQHVITRQERRSTRKYVKPSLKTIATEKISRDKEKLKAQALYMKNLLKTEKARLAVIAKVEKKKEQKVQLILNLSISRAKKASYRNFQYPSAVIDSMGYDPSSLIMYVNWNEGGDGYYENIPPDVFEAASNGDEWCRTEGSNLYGSWYVGKQPSRGAYMYWNIRGNPQYEYTRLSK